MLVGYAAPVNSGRMTVLQYRMVKTVLQYCNSKF